MSHMKDEVSHLILFPKVSFALLLLQMPLLVMSVGPMPSTRHGVMIRECREIQRGRDTGLHFDKV